MQLSATQLLLFSPPPLQVAPSVPVDATSEQLLDMFRSARLAAGAHPQSVRREVSQLRSLARAASAGSGPSDLAAIATDMPLVARLLLDPPTSIARSTGRARLVAIQRFVSVVAQPLGLNASEQLAHLDHLLPARRSPGWHSTGITVAGEAGRRRRLCPTLDGSDLQRIVAKAAQDETGPNAARDSALVTLACFSGLRPEEIAALHWEHLSWDSAASGGQGITIRLARRDRGVEVLLPSIAAAAIIALVELYGAEQIHHSGPVFRARGRSGRALSYRTVRSVICSACRRAGFPGAEAVDLRAAFAWWLKAQGLSDHEVATVLGFARVRSVDRLLRRHAELYAQRQVRERVGAAN